MSAWVKANFLKADLEPEILMSAGHSWNLGKLAATLWEVKKATHADD
jgi:hypothetical protein